MTKLFFQHQCIESEAKMDLWRIKLVSKLCLGLKEYDHHCLVVFPSFCKLPKIALSYLKKKGFRKTLKVFLYLFLAETNQ